MALAGATKRMPSAEATSPEPQCWTSGNLQWAATMRALAASSVSGRMKFWPIQESRSRRRAGISSRTMGSSPILQASPIRAAHRLISKCSILAWRSLKCVKARAKPVRAIVSSKDIGHADFGHAALNRGPQEAQALGIEDLIKWGDDK